ncbi:MAG: DUF1566 domain-containing protein [Acidobacteriota bacterium]
MRMPWVTLLALVSSGVLHALTYPIVDTGQTTCYDTREAIICPGQGHPFHGQDASFAGHQPSYTDHADGTVTDNVTGLMWGKSPDVNGDGTIDATDKRTLDAALAGAASSRLAGYDDWRLPTIKELYSLIRFDGTDPSGARGRQVQVTPFLDYGVFGFAYGDQNAGERLIDAQFVSSTRYVGDQELVFGVNFADGRIKGYGLYRRGRGEKTFYVLYVRGNPDYGVNDFADHGDGTITDRATGLMWSRTDSGMAFDWSDALAWVAKMNAASYFGHSDWRLPNAKELQSLVDYDRSPDSTDSPAIDPIFGVTQIVNELGRADYPFYWTSTTHANVSSNPGNSAVYIAFGRSLGNMRGRWIDVHGAGSQRSDPKTGDPDAFPRGRGPQGDAIHIENYVRLVRDAGS